MANKTLMAQGRSGADIDMIALNIIKKYQPHVLEKPQEFDVLDFFDLEFEEHTGVVPDYSELPQGIFGVTDSNEMTATISSDMVEDPSQEQFARSTIAHECGHGVIHVREFRQKRALLQSYQLQYEPKLYRKQDVPTYRNPEWQAHRFAGALLMPKPTVVMAIDNGATISELSDTYNVSIPFVISRLKALKVSVKNKKGGFFN